MVYKWYMLPNKGIICYWSHLLREPGNSSDIHSLEAWMMPQNVYRAPILDREVEIPWWCMGWFGEVWGWTSHGFFGSPFQVALLGNLRVFSGKSRNLVQYSFILELDFFNPVKNRIRQKIDATFQQRNLGMNSNNWKRANLKLYLRLM